MLRVVAATTSLTKDRWAMRLTMLVMSLTSVWCFVVRLTMPPVEVVHPCGPFVDA